MGQVPHNGEAISYVMTALQKEIRFLNGNIKRTFAFDIQAKNKSWLTAINTLDTIGSILEGATRQDIHSNNGSFVFDKARMRQPSKYLGYINDDDKKGTNTFAVYGAYFEITAVLNSRAAILNGGK